MLLWLLTFVSVFTVNVFYAYYIRAAQESRYIAASGWSALINLVASITAIGYIENHWLIIPSCIGSFFGTLAGVYFKK